MKRIVGVENVCYENKKGVRVQGVRLHVLSSMLSPNVGDSCNSYYVSDRSVADFPLGEIQTLLFEPTGYGDKMKCTGAIYVNHDLANVNKK